MEQKRHSLIEKFGLIAIPLVGVILVGYQVAAGMINRQHEVMSQYLDQMTQLLTEGDLDSGSPQPRTRMAARAITINASRQLNAERKGQLLRFLYESGLIGNCEPFNPKTIQPPKCDKTALVDLSTAKLEGAKSDNSGKSLFLQGAVLSSVDLTGANLQDVGLNEAVMNKTTLKSANLSRALLEGANMEAAKLNDANLSGARLQGSNLKHADLWGSDLSCTKDPNNKKLLCADLSKASLTEANLKEANLRGANLNTSSLREAELAKAVYDDKTVFPPGFDEAQRMQKGMINAAESSANQPITLHPSNIQAMTNCSYTLSYCVPISR